jgi:Phosphotransferase enzyme family
MRRKPADPETAARRAQFIVSALDQFAEEMPPVFRRLGDLYAARSLDIISLFNEGEHTLIHGDTHSGNLFVDAGRTGFYDWASRAAGPACAMSRTSRRDGFTVATDRGVAGRDGQHDTGDRGSRFTWIARTPARLTAPAGCVRRAA